MADNTLEERGRALENQFFDKENKAKLAAMKSKLEGQQTREELRKASGMTDEAVLDKLVSLGLRGNTIAALSLVPLIYVAWADCRFRTSCANDDIVYSTSTNGTTWSAVKRIPVVGTTSSAETVSGLRKSL